MDVTTINKLGVVLDAQRRIWNRADELRNKPQSFLDVVEELGAMSMDARECYNDIDRLITHLTTVED